MPARPGDRSARLLPLLLDDEAIATAVSLRLVAGGVQVDAVLLVTLARACRDAVRLRFLYAGHDPVAHVQARPDPVAHVQRSVVAAPYRYVARVRVHPDAERVRRAVPPIGTAGAS